MSAASRRSAGMLLAIVLLLVHAGASAQSRSAIPRVGVLSPFVGSESLFFDILRQRLHELGYTEGRNIAYVYRVAEDFDALQRHARELVEMNVSVIVTAGPPGVRAARAATRTIPIVMGNVGDALDQGFVDNLAKPSGNVTGLSTLNTELGAKRLALLKEALPSVTRVAVLREAVGDVAPLRATEQAARTLGIALDVFQVRDADELPSAFHAMAAAHVTSLAILPSSLFVSQLRRIVEFAVRARIATIYPDDRFVRAGGLMSYGSDVADLYARAAVYVSRILKGARPADLPVEQPTTFVLAVNVRAARDLGLTLPPSLLVRANHVVQ